jgi:hypothetical protein
MGAFILGLALASIAFAASLTACTEIEAELRKLLLRLISAEPRAE